MSEIEKLRNIIDSSWENITELSSSNYDIVDAVEETIEKLDSGDLRVAEKINGEWKVNQWLKKAVLISFRIKDNEILRGPYTAGLTKLKVKLHSGVKTNGNRQAFEMFPMELLEKERM